MTNALVIVESPAKAKTLAKILGKGYQIKASGGHIRDLPKKKLGVDVRKGFLPSYEVLPEKENIVKELQQAAKKADSVFLAPDPDREGEAIAWHLAALLKEVGVENIQRIEFNEITKEAIKKAIKHPRLLNVERVNAQQARRVLDRLVGYKISPLLWQKVKRGLSAGRVQSVATRLVCDRETDIEAFKPEEYWRIQTEVAKIGQKEVFPAELVKIGNRKAKITNQADATKLVTQIQSGDIIVSDIAKKDVKRSPSAPFITSTLQQEASRRYGFTVKRTMAIAQELYEGMELGPDGQIALITYMRTDSTRVAKEAQQDARTYIKEAYGSEYLPKTPPIYKSRASAQDAHEAIRPTYLHRHPKEVKAFLKPDYYKLYKLVWERFMASQMEPMILDQNTVDMTSGDLLLRASYSSVKFDGFTKVYSDTAEEGSEDNESSKKPLPPVTVGEKLNLKKITPTQHFTQAPPRYTEASLVRALEEKGIGRPSTYAPTISTIVQRGYVTRETRQLSPTDLGRQVNEQLVQYFPNIVDVGFTAAMEDKLDKVEGGEDWQTVIKDFYGPFNETLKAAKVEMKPVEIPSGEFCENCGKEMMIKSGRFGDFLACSGYPECKNAKPILKKIGIICRLPDCGGDIIEKRSRKGAVFFGCTNYPTCTFTSWDQPTDKTCPECSTLMVIKKSKKGSDFLLCTNETCKKIMNIPRKRKQESSEDEAETVLTPAS